ncbi:MAG: sigma 54-interacting transcriptional regulator [Candidatus Eisenbacteria bacterium]
MNYTIKRRIGSGSYGTVYEAYDDAGTRYAAKVVKADDPVALGLLKSQFEFLSALNHRRIVEAVDFDATSPLGPMMVTEFVDGVDLKTFAEAGGREHLFEVSLKILDALRYLHGLGRLHGDLKPDGVLVFEVPGGVEVKLVDAGFDFERGTGLPTIAGTLPYLAPEIIRNLPADGRSDLYSLGVALYEALTGVCPFEGGTSEEILKKHLEHDPAEPSRIRPSVSTSWDDFVRGLIKKEPLLRYRDATEAGLELGRLFGRPGAFVECLAPAVDVPLFGLETAIERIQGLVGPRGRIEIKKGVMIYGERGCGVDRLLRLAEIAAKTGGCKVSRVALKPDMPAFAQIVEAVSGGSVGFESSRIQMDSAGGDPSGSLGEVLAALEIGFSGDRSELLVVDGGEAMDTGELGVLARVAQRLPGRLSIVVGYETDELKPDDRARNNDFEIIRCDGFGPQDLEGALKLHFGVGTLPVGLAEETYRTTRGNRRFLEIVLRHLWEIGGLRYQVGGGLLELAWDRSSRVPASLEDIMRERLGALSPSALETLGLVCVSGGRLALENVRDFFLPADCTLWIDEILNEGFVDRIDGKPSLRLRWDGLADVVLGLLPHDRTEAASGRLAAIMERKVRGPSEHYGLGLLYLQAGNCAAAFKSLTEAGDHFAGFSPSDAILAYGKAVECDVAPSLRDEVTEKIGDVRLARGDLKGALACFQQTSVVRPSAMRKLGWVQGLRGNTEVSVTLLLECEKRAATAGDLLERARVLSDLGYNYSRQSKRDIAISALSEACRFFEERRMPFEAGVASNRMGILEMRSGNVKHAARAWEKAKASFEQSGSKRHVGMCLMALGLCYWKQMDFGSATQFFTNALAIFEATKSLAEKAACCQNYGVVLVDVGDLAGARSVAQEALGLHTLLGYNPGIVSTRLLLASIELEAGNLGEVRQNLDQLALGSCGLTVYEQSLLKHYLAAASAIAGDLARALDLLDESYRLACEAGDADGQRQAMLRRSEILLRFGRPQEALEIANKAVTAFGLASSALLATIAERAAGEALCLSGRIEEGTARLLEAKASLESIGESLHMARTLRGLALAHYLSRDYGSFERYFRLAAGIFRRRAARYDYALVLLLAGQAAGSQASFIKARRYLAEAGRIFKDLGVSDLHSQVVDQMERFGPDDTEIKAVASLSKISQTLNSSHDLTTVLNLAMDLAMEYLGAERGVLMLEAEAPGGPTAIVERKMDKESVKEAISISRSIVESVRSTRESVIASDATIDPRFKNSKSVKIHNVMSVMCVPLMREDALVGIIYLDNRDVPSDFSRLERAFVDAFANQVVLAIENARNVGKLYDDVADLKARAGERYSFANIIGPGKEMQEVFRQVEKAAKSSITVLVTGESGTGKELIAGLLHQLSPRRDKPLVKVNCAAIHRDLLETELFGIEKHVATGIAPRSGFFERADGGTVLLDEVGDMPLTTQTKVLRVLAEKEFERVGGSKVLKIDVRVISATNQDLKDLIKRDRFRRDLYYRLNAMHIHLPPLRERISDLPILVDRFVKKYAAENSKGTMQISRATLDVLMRYPWPGNVRELEKFVEHAVVVADGSEIRVEHFPREVLATVTGLGGEIAAFASAGPLPEVVRQVERDLIRRALDDAGGVKTVAANRLGIHESTLRKKMKALGIREAVE